jgi:hypothetical protein
MTLTPDHTCREGSELDRDARTLHIMQPTTDLLRIWMGRSLLNQSLLTDT